jgi:hypothetical protein
MFSNNETLNVDLKALKPLPMFADEMPKSNHSMMNRFTGDVSKVNQWKYYL